MNKGLEIIKNILEWWITLSINIFGYNIKVYSILGFFTVVFIISSVWNVVTGGVNNDGE